jgi:hypothetical protein
LVATSIRILLLHPTCDVTAESECELLSQSTPIWNTPPFGTPKLSENPDRYFYNLIYIYYNSNFKPLVFWIYYLCVIMPRYAKSDLLAALHDIQNGKSLRLASREWGIPLTTLYNRNHSSSSHTFAAEIQQRLSKLQEEHLTAWVLAQEALGMPLTYGQIRDFAKRVLDIKGDYEQLGKRWIVGFLRRNPILRTKRARTIDSVRVNGATTAIIKGWFPRLSIPAILAIKPENRWNMDESSIMEGLGVNGLVVRSTQKRSIQKKQPGSRAWTSFVECISATSNALPPLVIFKGKTVQQQ